MTSEDPAQEARRRGNAARAAGDYLQALNALDDAVLLSPGDIAGWHDRGALMLEMDEPVQALRDFEAGLVLAPRDARLLSGRAAAFLALANYDAALAAADLAAATQPQVPGLHELRALALHGLEQLDAAIVEQRLAVADSPMDGRCRYNLGRLLEEAGRLEEASDSYLVAITLAPDCEAAAQARVRVNARLRP